MPTTDMTVNLLAGESIKIAGPGLVEFHAAEALPIAKTVATGATKMGAGQTMATAQTTQLGFGTTSATATTAAAKTAGTAGGTIWTGKGLSLGLGLGLGAWGPVILVSGATLGYIYWRRSKAAKIWPF
ncbi:MAG: hypothetical protein H7832_03860 [Magnetococcus sp. DMHC-6]